MNRIHFTKMHGLGNDFIVINALKNSIHLTPDKIKQLSDRQLGIGFDQLLLIQPSTQANFYCRIFNADGSEAEQCGNGLRCVARFIHEEKLSPQSSFTIETKAGVFPIVIDDYDHIRITLPEPQLQHPEMELEFDHQYGTISAAILSAGNPHAIIRVESLTVAPIDKLGFAISTHPSFPNGTNVGFMQIINPSHIKLRTFERGSGETHACGSNACAAAFTGLINGWLTSPVTVEFRYGSLLIERDETNKRLYMTGPASRVFEGDL